MTTCQLHVDKPATDAGEWFMPIHARWCDLNWFEPGTKCTCAKRPQ